MVKSIRSLMVLIMTMCLGTAACGGIVRQIDLASDTEWTLRIDGGASRPIKVSGGGWNSDKQSPIINKDKDVKDHVIYERKIEIPEFSPGQLIKLRFGAVNFGAQVFIDGKLVGEHDGPMVPFEVDLSRHVASGKSYTLAVKAFNISHYAKEGKKPEWGYQPDSTFGGYRIATGFIYPFYDHLNSDYAKFAVGITRYVKLAVYTPVYVSDVFVRPSVTKKNLTYDVTVTNSTDRVQKLKVKSSLSSWNGDNWTYPDIADKEIVVAAGSTATVTVGPVPWTLGQKSYWWPNIPFREDYTARLHNLNLSLLSEGKAVDRFTQRFGFVEHAEGPYYYTVNGVRINCASDSTTESQMSEYDAYTASPAFNTKKGCAETWKRYMRIGIAANRTHQTIPTEHIMNVADEVGFLLIAETPIRGSERSYPQAWDDVYHPQCVQDLARVCRNHPSVARYSLCNEFPHTDPWTRLIDAILTVDNTRPLVFETNTTNVPEKLTGKKGHAWTTLHYKQHPRPARTICTVGEYAWENDGIPTFATVAKDMRFNDVTCFSGWSWINYWPNFLEGMSHEKHGWKQNNHEDRKDGVDGWGSHVVKYTQRSLHRFLVMDHGIETLNIYSPDWPAEVPVYKPGAPISRKIELFNDDLFGNRLTLKWTAKYDSPTGPVAASGTISDIIVEPGFHKICEVSFAAPKADRDRRMYLVLESVKDGKVVYKEDRIYFILSNDTEAKSDAVFIRTDETTQGDWRGKYGSDGYELIGREQKLAPYSKIEWGGFEWVWQGAISDKRALWYFNNPPTDKDRIAAIRCQGTVLSLSVDVGPNWHQVALYFLDFNREWITMELEIPLPYSNSVLSQPVEKFGEGKYLIFNIRGKVTINLRHIGGSNNSVISGIFFDPVGK